MEKITQFTSKAIILPIDDVDTDQIVPARFLTTTEREGIGVALFIDWRLDKDGNELDHMIIVQVPYKGTNYMLCAWENKSEPDEVKVKKWIKV